MSNSLLLRVFFWLVIAPGILFVAGIVIMLAIANLPLPAPSFSPGPAPRHDTTHIMVFAHGKDSSPEQWQDAFSGLTANFAASQPGTEVLIPDWSAWSHNFLRVSLNGLGRGKQTGEYLAGFKQLRSVHVIGHSAGAFFAHGVCKRLKLLRPDITIQVTYIAALAIYGALFRNYGPKNFGDCGDFQDNWFDRGDTVPGGSTPLPMTHAFDVTPLRPTDRSPHVAPMYVYAKLLAKGLALTLGDHSELARKYPRGELTLITRDSVDSALQNRP